MLTKQLRSDQPELEHGTPHCTVIMKVIKDLQFSSLQIHAEDGRQPIYNARWIGRASCACACEKGLCKYKGSDGGLGSFT